MKFWNALAKACEHAQFSGVDKVGILRKEDEKYKCIVRCGDGEEGLLSISPIIITPKAFFLDDWDIEI